MGLARLPGVRVSEPSCSDEFRLATWSGLSTSGADRRCHPEITPEPEIREIAAQPAAVKRAVTDAAGMPGTIDEGFAELFARLAERNAAPAGAPYIRYLETGERLELELGVPAREDAADAGLPGGRAAVLRHIGPYVQLREQCERLVKWVERRGEAPAGPHWEAYVTDPRSEPDPSKRITDIYLPLR
jgi:effector-binding domain-containing protein